MGSLCFPQAKCTQTENAQVQNGATLYTTTCYLREQAMATAYDQWFSDFKYLPLTSLLWPDKWADTLKKNHHHNI